MRPHRKFASNLLHEVELVHRLFDQMVLEDLGLGSDLHRKELELLILALGFDTPYLACARRFHMPCHLKVRQFDKKPLLAIPLLLRKEAPTLLLKASSCRLIDLIVAFLGCLDLFETRLHSFREVENGLIFGSIRLLDIDVEL